MILTFGMCKTVYRFLKEAAKKRKFQVVVAEGAPDFRGQQLARSLAEAGIMARLGRGCAARVNRVRRACPVFCASLRRLHPLLHC